MKISKNFLFIGLLSLSLLPSCHHDDTVALVGNWLERKDFEGDARSEAVAFAIGNVGYVGLGYNGEDRLKDFWAYDADRNNWTQIADFDSSARTAAVAFSAAGKGYVGTGYDGKTKLADFEAYNPVTNTWDKSIADFEGSARYAAVAFSIDNIGYVGTGYDGSDLMDFWAYNPETDSWEQKNSFQSKVQEAVGFVLNGKGYITTGYHNTYNLDFYMYDPANDTWTEKRKIGNVSDESYDDKYTIQRKKAVAFTVGSKAYITTGDVGSTKSDVWEYDAATDLWTARTDFEGTGRKDAVAFSTEDGRGYVAVGISGSTYFDDIWEFKPTEKFNEDD
jgi:hypothetical protein